MSKFSKNLIQLRKECKLSQQQLAIEIQVTQQCVSEWENDGNEPTMTNLWKLADLFKISVDELIGRTEY